MAVLGSLYVAQGVVAGFAGFVLVPTLAASGASLEAQTGLVALTSLPWVLKVLWGPLLDRFGARDGGRARVIVSLAMLGAAAVLLVMGAGLPDRAALVDNLARVHVQWFVLGLLLSLQDVGTDALALDRVQADDRGFANGVMLGGHHVGNEAFGGLALGAIVGAMGVGWGFTAIGALLVLTAAAPMLLPPTPDRTVASTPVGLAQAMRGVLSTPRARWAAALALVVLAGDIITSATSGAFWVTRLGWTVPQITAELPPLLLVGNVAGYFIAGVTTDRVGPVRATAGAAITLGLLWAGFGVAEPWWPDAAFLRGFVVVQAVVTAVMMVGLHAVLMGAVVPRIRATHFTLLMALVNVPRVALAPLAPGLLEALGFAGLFIACGGLQVAVGAAVRWQRVALRAED